MIRYEGRNRRTVNYLKTVYFDYPEWTCCGVGLMPATWIKYREDLERLVLAHRKVFPDFRQGSVDYDRVFDPTYEVGRHQDAWGCVWETRARGLQGAPVTHPLADWSALETYRPPNPMTEDLFGPRPCWEEVQRGMDKARRRGDLATGGLAHGFMYMILYFLRGFENFMMDLATEDPRLRRLIGMVENYNAALIRKYLELGAEQMVFGDDLGLQKSLPMSPAMWRRWMKPPYARLLGRCREAGVMTYLHTDGHVLEIIPDLIEVGVNVLNPQIRANGLEGLRRMAKGKVAINLDLDRQLFPFATPRQIEDHIGEMFEGLSMQEGGLMLFAECEPDVPLENIDAICRTFEKLCHPPDPDD